MFFSVGIAKVLYLSDGISSSALLAWTLGVWTTRRWTKRWRRMRLLNLWAAAPKGNALEDTPTNVVGGDEAVA